MSTLVNDINSTYTDNGWDSYWNSTILSSALDEQSDTKLQFNKHWVIF
jgi:hypothetical protein